ncbi:DUF6624 domain-containing protein [Runella slithyformis]|uniref:Uncharacterized protein n=1 Tax=Runella slithyformis (strain ATCC 29530 / DSM 19594 / LMG 11500 / NCIMB 11436 / LSU 4) TaxID=761193 RepID=A0A7U4E4K4_RUNSL|nr:DUF6624 domain-containing protein [Runella slithyformis]AEI47364.1 hypothetical protein Runsl_0927 [Runella slithyformis DSM 19594]
MKICIIFLLLISIGKVSFCQSLREDYESKSKAADSLYNLKQYKNAAIKYSIIFQENGGLGYVDDRYKAACSWALINEPDSSFYQLFRIANKGNYDEYEKIINEPNFENLHKDEQWSKLLDIIYKNKENKEKNYNRNLISVLDTIFEEDQKYRLQIKSIKEKYGADSDEINEIFRIIALKDSINLLKVQNILDKYGWLGPDVIKEKGSTTLFLVIQHADLSTQIKYLPILKEAVRLGKAENSALALLEDRVALQQGKCQIYGTQIDYDTQTRTYYIPSLCDPISVNKRREEVGLNPIEEYVKNWNINWDSKNYSKSSKK